MAGGLILVGATAGLRRSPAADTIDIAMAGSTGGAHVWFRPAGLLIQPGQTLRWTNHDAGNSHTATAYHPNFYEKPQRIPADAQPWDSGFLLPGESFLLTLTVPGVYDYYCLPHELAGMVGRIIVEGPATDQGWRKLPPDGRIPKQALHSFPSVERILQEKSVDS